MAFYATRPEHFTDLEGTDARPDAFLELNTHLITHDTTVGAAALTLIEACRNSEHFNVSEDGEFKVTRPLNEEEQERALRQAQREYDRETELIEKVLAGEPIYKYASWQVPHIARARGIHDVPDVIVEADQ